MKRIVKILGNVVVCATVILLASGWVASAFIELPQKQNYNLDWYEVVWLVAVILAAIYTTWRLLKFTAYQMSFTVTKAIYDAKNDKRKKQ